jgi:hypothetical protein
MTFGVSVNDSTIKSYCLFPQSFSSVKIQINLLCNDFIHFFEIAIGGEPLSVYAKMSEIYETSGV